MTTPDSEPILDSTRPTYLNLFNYSAVQLTQVRAMEVGIKNQVDQTKGQQVFWTKKLAQTEEIYDKLLEYHRDIEKNQAVTAVSISLGRAYQFFTEEFRPQGRSNEQIFDFFKTCLDVQYRMVHAFHLGEKGAMQRPNARTYNSATEPIFEEVAQQTPTWFQGTGKEYASLVKSNYPFLVYLITDPGNLTNELALNTLRRARKEGISAVIPILNESIESYIPDWLDSDVPPSDDTVQREITSDIKDFQDLAKTDQHLRAERDHLVESLKEKIEKAINRLYGRRVEVVPYPPSLVSTLVTIQNIISYDPSIEIVIRSLDPDYNRDVNYYIRNFTDSEDRLTDPEAMSLWLESIFNNAGIISRGEYTLLGKDTLTTFLEYLGPQPTPEQIERFASLRNKDKKTYQPLHYELEPLFRLLSPDDLIFLQTLVYDANLGDYPPKSLIPDFVDFITTSIRNTEANSAKAETLGKTPLTPAFNKYREFLRKFMRRNWQWLYRQLKETIRVQPSIDTQTDQTLVDTDVIVQPEVEELNKEMEKEISEVEKGKLDGWRIQYALDASLKENELLEIEGETLEEKSEDLKKKLVRYGVSCSVSPATIISALERKTSISPQEEQLVPVYNIKGVEYKRKRVGPVRMFYRMDQKSQSFVFLLEQKKSWAHNFRGL